MAWFSGRSAVAPEAVLLGGDDTLEVVGESYHLDNIWRIVGGRPSSTVRRPIRAVLIPETDNPHDANAVAIVIDGLLVGYLSRADAVAYRPGLLRLYEQHAGRPIALGGVIYGEGDFLGVFLDHDPADFGLTRKQFMRPVPELRTGLSEAIGTDVDDDSYDLGWLEKLPRDDGNAIPYLRGWLQRDRDVISRHFLFCHLEKSLYRLRDYGPAMLAEFDQVCAAHDAEMDLIRDHLVAKFGKVPILETYRQAAIRHQKAKDWPAARWWAERGLSLYGELAARPEAREDLMKRVAMASAKLGAAAGAMGSSSAAPMVEDEVSAHIAVAAATTEQAAAPVAPAGWYADPAGRFEFRWWDGAAWTPTVARHGQPQFDPI